MKKPIIAMTVIAAATFVTWVAVAALVHRGTLKPQPTPVERSESGNAQVLAGPGIIVNNVIVGSATVLTAQLTVAPDAATGPRSLTVTVPGEIEATLPNGFRVQ